MYLSTYYNYHLIYNNYNREQQVQQAQERVQISQHLNANLKRNQFQFEY